MGGCASVCGIANHTLAVERARLLQAQTNVELVDLANELDTTRWYARRLRRAASGLVSRLAPLTLFVHRAEPKALEDAAWNATTEHGTFALAAWCERWGIEFLGALSPLAASSGRQDGEKRAQVVRK